MSFIIIPGLSTLVKTLILVCNVIDKHGTRIRPYVPEASQTAYDNALTAIKSACEVIRAIDYLDDYVSTNPPWGS